MILEQHYLSCLAQASYLIVDEKTKTAVVVDPRRDVDVYVERANELGARIEHVLLTHFHADFLAGHLELRERCGAKIWLGHRGKAEFATEPIRDGEALEFGDVRIEFLETPGHTPESVCFVVYDLANDRENPYAVLTGDTLFIGDVGRPDLLGSVGLTKEQLAGWLYDSLRQKLMTLPDETILYPGHGAGSACGKNLSSETSCTIGRQKQFNYALQDMPKDDFVRIVTEGLSAPPAYFPHDAVLNRKERSTLADVMKESNRALSVDEALELQASGAQVLDTRTADEYSAGHLKGSINIGLNGSFASWAGTVLDMNAKIVLVSDDAEEATMRLGRIGFDQVIGHVEGGYAAIAKRPELTRTHRRVTPDELGRLLASENPPRVIDVRTPTEFEDGHIEGAAHIPLDGFSARLDEVPADREVVLICRSGYRSCVAASLADRAGRFDPSRLMDLAGGMQAWQATSGV